MSRLPELGNSSRNDERPAIFESRDSTPVHATRVSYEHCRGLALIVLLLSGIPLAALPALLPSAHGYSMTMAQVGSSGNWSVPDTGGIGLFPVTHAGDYRFANSGPDYVTIRIYNSALEQIASSTVASGNSWDVGIPAGGHAEIEDANPGNGQGASGTWAKL